MFRKEILEMLRDKRVAYSALLGPVFLVVLFLFLFGFLKSSLQRQEGSTLHVVRVDPEPSFLRELERDKRFTIRRIATLEEGEELVRSGKARVALRFPRDFDASLRANKPGTVEVIYDGEEPASEIVASKLDQSIGAASKAKVVELLRSKGLSPDLAEPIKLKKRPVRREQEAFGGFLAALLPYLIVIWSFYGGFSVASDFVAGEKERSTLETLLISPVDRVRIALGKFWALSLLCAASGVSSLVAVFVAGNLPIDTIRELFPDGVRISIVSTLAILGVIVPLSAMFAGLLLALSAFARNIRECQGYFTLVSFIVLMPAVFSQFIGYTDFAKAAWVSWVPILNSASVLRGAMLANYETVPLLTTIGVNVALAVIAMRVVAWLFEREQALWRI